MGLEHWHMDLNCNSLRNSLISGHFGQHLNHIHICCVVIIFICFPIGYSTIAYSRQLLSTIHKNEKANSGISVIYSKVLSTYLNSNRNKREYSPWISLSQRVALCSTLLSSSSSSSSSSFR